MRRGGWVPDALRWPYPAWGRLPWGWVAGVWAALAVVDEARFYLFSVLVGMPLSRWAEMLPARAADVVLWTLLTPAVFWITERFTLRRRRWAAPLAAQVAAALCAGWLGVLCRYPVATALERSGGFWTFWAQRYHAGIFTWIVVAAFAHMLAYSHRARERALQAAQLRAQLAQAQVEVLKAQIEPHFLFNTLNTISELVHESPDAAERMVDSLDRLLRLAIAEGQQAEVSLAREMEFLRAYLDIQQTRFQDRLEVGFRVDAEALAASVPTFLLQPLVENAIRHGIAPRARRGRVEVRAARDGDALRLEVRDDGVGLEGGSGGGGGLGLRNTRDRLRRMYGAGQRFEIRAGEGGGVVAAVRIPWHTVPQAIPPDEAVR